MTETKLQPDQFFIGVMHNRDQKLYGAISPSPFAVPMMFALAFLIGLLIGSFL